MASKMRKQRIFGSKACIAKKSAGTELTILDFTSWERKLARALKAGSILIRIDEAQKAGSLFLVFELFS